MFRVRHPFLKFRLVVLTIESTETALDRNDVAARLNALVLGDRAISSHGG